VRAERLLDGRISAFRCRVMSRCDSQYAGRHSPARITSIEGRALRTGKEEKEEQQRGDGSGLANATQATLIWLRFTRRSSAARSRRSLGTVGVSTEARKRLPRRCSTTSRACSKSRVNTTVDPMGFTAACSCPQPHALLGSKKLER
jgi:hypothetical protein